MSFNACIVTNESSHLHSSSNSSNLPKFVSCFTSSPSSFIITGFFVTYIVTVLPLCILILHRGCQTLCRKQSNAPATVMSHADFFTYNLVFMELTGITGCFVTSCGIYTGNIDLLAVGLPPACLILLGQAFFHVLTCVERYLAVVHPITYMNLRSKRMTRVRNVCVSAGWLICFFGMGLLLIEKVFVIFDFCLLTAGIMIVSFCSLSVLCVLVRPGPGEQSGDRHSMDQTKKRAFVTIMVILGMLVFRFVSGLSRSIVSLTRFDMDYCIIMTGSFFFYVPSSMVLPLMFLHRAGKLPCSKNNV